MVLAQTNAALTGINSFQLITLQPIDLATARSKENGCIGRLCLWQVAQLLWCLAAGGSAVPACLHISQGLKNTTTLTSVISILKYNSFFLERMGLALRDSGFLQTNESLGSYP